MNTAKRGTYAGTLLDEGYTAIQVVTSEENMIKQ